MEKSNINEHIGKICQEYRAKNHLTQNQVADIILYDLLDEDVKKSVSIYEEKFKKLSIRDKQSILHFIDYFLSNN